MIRADAYNDHAERNHAEDKHCNHAYVQRSLSFHAVYFSFLLLTVKNIAIRIFNALGTLLFLIKSKLFARAISL